MAFFHDPGNSLEGSPDGAPQPELGHASLRAELRDYFARCVDSRGQLISDLQAAESKPASDACIRELLRLFPSDPDIAYVPLSAWQSQDAQEVIVICEVVDVDGIHLRVTGANAEQNPDWKNCPGLGHMAMLIKYSRVEGGRLKFEDARTLLSTQELERQIKRFLDDQPNILGAEIKKCFAALGLDIDDYTFQECSDERADVALRLAYCRSGTENKDPELVIAVGASTYFGVLEALPLFAPRATRIPAPTKPIVGLTQYAQMLLSEGGWVQDLELEPPASFDGQKIDQCIRLALANGLNPAQKAAMSTQLHALVYDVSRSPCARIVFSCSQATGGYLIPGPELAKASSSGVFVGIVWEVSDLQPEDEQAEPSIQQVCAHLGNGADFSVFPDAGYVIAPEVLRKMLEDLKRRPAESVLGQHIALKVWEDLVNDDVVPAADELSFSVWEVEASVLPPAWGAPKDEVVLSFKVSSNFGFHVVQCVYSLNDGFLDLLSMGVTASVCCPQEEDGEGEGADVDEEDDEDGEDPADAWKNGAGPEQDD